MTETNYLELIKNKLDSLVDKMVQKENSDEDFRITYAQILEKINTKMDVFSNSEEVKTILIERKDVVDAKFSAIKLEFDSLQGLLTNSLKTPELLAAFDKIQNQIHFFAEEQENQKFAFNSMISHIEKFGTLEETNEKLESEFTVVKQQNTAINENLNKYVNLLDEISKIEQENSQKVCESINNIVFDLKEFSESVKTMATAETAEKIVNLVNEKTNNIITRIHEIDMTVDYIDDCLTDLIKNSEKFVTVEILDEKLENAVEDITDIISEESIAASNQMNVISSSIETLRNDLSTIISTETEDQDERFSESLKDLQVKFVSQIIQIADNISFSEEAEEINDNIFNCSDEIKEKISTDISEIKNEFSLLKDEAKEDNGKVVELLEKIDEIVKTDINNDLKTLISGFKLITSGLSEDKDYIYTLPDIESDLSKIRLDLNTIQQSIVSSESISEESSNEIADKINNLKAAIEKLEDNPIHSEISEVKGLFDTLNEDISSISKRTNKLILTSDEVNKTLKSNIDAFSGLIKGFEAQSHEFYNSSFLKNIHSKLEGIKHTTTSLEHSDKVLNEAFMYLAEWIDTTSESFDEIKTDIAKIKRNVLSDDENVTEKLLRSIKTLSSQVEEQDEKLNRILAQQNETKELKSLVEYVASQVSVTNEKIIENEKLSQKITSMEKQLKKIEKNVSRITEYLDEDEQTSEESEI